MESIIKIDSIAGNVLIDFFFLYEYNININRKKMLNEEKIVNDAKLTLRSFGPLFDKYHDKIFSFNSI